MSSNIGRGRVGFVERLKTGWTLTKDSLGVVRDHPRLLAFPLLAGVASLCFLALLLVPLLAANLFGSGVEYAVLFVLYFVTTFASTYFSAALVYAANEAFHGREPGLRESLGAIRGRLGPILAWAAIAATVSIVIKALEDADNPVAALLGSLFAVGWSILTFFIVPVIVFEDVSVTTMFERSGETFRDTWGEILSAGFGITLIVGLIGLVLVGVALAVSVPVASAFAGPGLFLGVVLVGGAVVFTVLLGQAIRGIAKTALYVYAVEGVVPDEFENFDFETLGGRTERSASPGAAGPTKTAADGR
ncbi:DUF6159 family protein [Saliphagus sp. LR7]|uniref:DUF6159 family protein n=1 Tax=Saliphagus sp. LR7 TaxID=2282654 RepID=UPI000DF7BC1C|nr:DUF6159 family protein [Saliphagus sp. LR7]